MKLAMPVARQERLASSPREAGQSGPAVHALHTTSATLPSVAEALVIKKLALSGKPALVLCGSDDRGLMYALLDVAQRVRWAANPREDPWSEVHDTTEPPFGADGS